MMKNHKLAQAIADVGLFEFRRQIEYKAKWNKRNVVFVDTFFPSSKQCSCCENVKTDLALRDRVYKCDVCGLEIDRDLNAAINLKQFYTGSFSEIDASGDGSSFVGASQLNSPSLKEEFNTKPRVYVLKR